MVNVVDIIPDIALDVRYAVENNFTGRVIYSDAAVYLRRSTAEKLASVQDELRAQGLSLCIWDGYRPLSAQQALWDACPDPRYVSDPVNGLSSHSRGNTVDITIIRNDGQPYEMPSDFDEFSSLADRDYSDVSAAAAEHALYLEQLMQAAGFRGYYGEWWHYTDTDDYPQLPSLE